MMRKYLVCMHMNIYFTSFRISYYFILPQELLFLGIHKKYIGFYLGTFAFRCYKFVISWSLHFLYEEHKSDRVLKGSLSW